APAAAPGRTAHIATAGSGGVIPEREASNDPTFARPVPAARPARSAAERGSRSGSTVVFESEAGEAYDTASAVEVPLEDGFPPRGTFSFWLNPSWGGTSQDDASFVNVADGRLRLVKNVSFLRFEAVDDQGFADGVGLRITDWAPEDWHFVTGTWDEGVITLYVDGVLVGQKFIPWLDVPEDSKLVLGSRFPPGRPVAIGTMTTFALQERPLSADAVGRKFQRTPPPLPDEGETAP
ncbi:MAG: LamG-like jellyroll fold domain-containing protein, partial [Thermodesulfobacteriota bacterium]